MKLYIKMDGISITKDRVVFNAIINALQTAGQWQQAVNILKTMNVTIPVSITSINPSEIFAQTQEIYSEALNEGFLKHWVEKSTVTTNKQTVSPKKVYEVKSRSLHVIDNNSTIDFSSKINISKKVMDLHGFPLPVAQAAIDRIFQEVLDSGDSDVSDITIITGKGNHINTSGTRGVLKTEIEIYISKNILPRGYLVLETSESNDGVLIIKKESIKEWIKAHTK
jgi:DNA-nicking Smr family endonuclease